MCSCMSTIYENMCSYYKKCNKEGKCRFLICNVKALKNLSMYIDDNYRYKGQIP